MDTSMTVSPYNHCAQMVNDYDQALVTLGQNLKATGYTFVTPTPLTLQRVNGRKSNALATGITGIFGWSRPFDQTLFDTLNLAGLQASGVIKRAENGWQSTVRWSSFGPLLIAHSAYPTDEADAVFFGPDTYRFARLINDHLSHCAVQITRAVDIGCGSGAGALMIANSCKNAEVLAVDINPRALRMTAVNIALAQARNVSIHKSDVLTAVSGTFDLIVANPPYMKDPHGRAYRHGGGTLGEQLSLRILAEGMPRLSLGGTLLLYTGVAMVEGRDPFYAEAQPLLLNGAYKSTYEELDPDVFGEELETDGYELVDRIAVVALRVTRIS